MKNLYSILAVAILAGAAYAQTADNCMQSGCGMGGQCIKSAPQQGSGNPQEGQAETSVCVCFQGFQVNRQTFRCEDVNECRSGMPLCRNGRCHNLIGAYVCDCFPGYRRSAPDGRRCVPMPSPPPRRRMMPLFNQMARCRALENMIEF